MTTRTLNDLIAAAITGGEEAEASATPTVEVRTETEKVASEAPDLGDIEKIAAALDFLADHDLGKVFNKEAAAVDPPAGTNAGQMHGEYTQKQQAPHAGAPPVTPPGAGQIPNNAKQRPGMPSPRDGVDTKGKETGTHHPALGSNDAAINYDKREKTKRVAPALSAVLDTTAFADPKLKENLSAASAKGDKNIHSKRAHDLNAVKAEIERRNKAGRA